MKRSKTRKLQVVGSQLGLVPMMESTYAAVMEMGIDIGEIMRGSIQAAVACLATWQDSILKLPRTIC